MKEPLITRRAIAAKLAVHMMTVTKWEREGLPIAKRGRKGKPSLYRENEVRAWLQAREEAAKTPDGALDLVQERAKKERWQGLLAEQLFQVRAKQLLPATEVEQAWIAEIAAARSVILSSYTTSADRVFRAATTDGLAGVERELKTIAHGVLRELADRPTKKPKKRKAA